MTQPRLDSKTALRVWTEHPHYRYRGCAPDPDDPRVAAGDNSVSVDAWQAPTADGGETKEAREAREAAAVDVCVGCPVMVQCLAYGSSLTPDGRLAEPYAILGGLTALERTKALVEERQAEPVRVVPEPAPVEQLRTPQKLAVLEALARFDTPEDIAVAAREALRREFGDTYAMDLRTAKWQLARLTTQLGLPKTAGRAEILEAAVGRGLLERAVLPDVPPVPAAAPAAGRSRRRPGRRGRRVTVLPGQLLAFDIADSPSGAPATTLFPNAPLEAAA